LRSLFLFFYGVVALSVIRDEGKIIAVESGSAGKRFLKVHANAIGLIATYYTLCPPSHLELQSAKVDDALVVC
jgi:hypothetical protein